MGTGVRPAMTSPGPWDAFADVAVFVDKVLVELEAMSSDGARQLSVLSQQTGSNQSYYGQSFAGRQIVAQMQGTNPKITTSTAARIF